MDIKFARVGEGIAALVENLVGEEAARQGVSARSCAEATRIVRGVALKRLSRIMEDTSDRDILDTRTEDDFVRDALATSRVGRGDVLARVVAGCERRQRIPLSTFAEMSLCLDRFGDEWCANPSLLYAQATRLSVDARAIALATVWSQSQFRRLPMPKWHSLFVSVGFMHDGARANRPASMPTLYRAAIPGCERNWSWTDSRTVAEWFRERVPGSELYVLEGIDPDSALARIDAIAENEWVVDVRASGATPVLVDHSDCAVRAI